MLGNKVFPSLKDIIREYKKEMRRPVEGSKYESIFRNYGSKMLGYFDYYK